MFSKILVANRGEIACRVIATAKRLGIKTVAIYSDVDSDSKHVAMADEAVRVGAAAVADSYLNRDPIIQAALERGAQAIHPGYGFLSENPSFVDDVEAAGLLFIGPSADAIRAMGLKDAAKELMEKAGVPIVPGYHGAEQDPDHLAAEANKIGYPVLIKARAGGGGKGMRLVENPEEFKNKLASAQREGQTSFGDQVCLIEKYISQPRHIEIQVFGDAYGNVVHLFERDCSLQRRHQKVIEEAPAPGMPQDVRDAMGSAAVEAAKFIGYQGAGTVEFIVDGSGDLTTDGFWFMEMNTRLQVEHPVSEAITGHDFVEIQMRVASGEPLPFAQDDLKISGHSFEARVYAEDVPRGFLPTTGRLNYLAFPKATEFKKGAVRIDSGVRSGDEISPWYDPMIAKVIVHGADRKTALSMLTAALADCHAAGSTTNLAFLGALSEHTGFGQGQVDTGLIGRDLDELLGQEEQPAEIIALAAIMGLGLLDAPTSGDPWDQLSGWRHWSNSEQYIVLETETEQLSCKLKFRHSGRYVVAIGETETLELGVEAIGGTRYLIEQNGYRHQLDAVLVKNCVTVFRQGRSDVFIIRDVLDRDHGVDAGGDAIIAPMPGLVKVVMAKMGQSVSKGDALLVLEAMKMEHTLCAPRDGVIDKLLVFKGDQVTDGTILLELEPIDG